MTSQNIERLSTQIEALLLRLEVELRSEVEPLLEKRSHYSLGASIDRSYQYGENGYATTISFSMYSDYSSDRVVASQLDQLVDEWKRRKGWSKANEPNALLQIAAPEPATVPAPSNEDDEVIF